MGVRILTFEIRYWLRSWMPWIFLAIITLISLLACTSTNINIGQRNCDWNAGYIVEQFYCILSMLTLLLTTVFANSTSTRDFATGWDQIIFACPIRTFDYLAGRLLGCTAVALIPMLGVSLGILIAPYAP